jgi:adenylylsulfate kinase-like enzyme
MRVARLADRFLEASVDAPLTLCEARDAKGLYACARSGRVVHLTRVRDPYAVPNFPHIVCAICTRSVEDDADELLAALVRDHAVPAYSDCASM